ncbi:hypothetical protein FB381_0159 [Nocardioides albertanoniae]|uniref:Uncharacterized protein n=1 Tax=Nocardioides albertanoniae TaxID=1175486 RepID=A0A543A139_9ACTN|nr:hypothetical protein [Nocardioides albertanoniae]TQL66308.1 hypothetical protein FB381_0159 [Nocardioides albertanoniae]
MGAAIISGLFAVALACLAWMFKNGSRRARLLNRIERYAQILDNLPDDHPARAHLDAVLAADTEQLLALTGRPTGHGAYEPTPTDDDADKDEDVIDWMGDEQERRISPPTAPSTPVAPPLSRAGRSKGVTNSTLPPRRALLSGNGSMILWVLAGLFAVATVGLVVNALWF